MSESHCRLNVPSDAVALTAFSAPIASVRAFSNFARSLAVTSCIAFAISAPPRPRPPAGASALSCSCIFFICSSRAFADSVLKLLRASLYAEMSDLVAFSSSESRFPTLVACAVHATIAFSSDRAPPAPRRRG